MYFFLVPFVTYILAQGIKTTLIWFKEEEITWQAFYRAGGMPSVHSATVISMLVTVFLEKGLGSTDFLIAFVLGGIVIYDAMGVRWAASQQARAINKLNRQIYGEGKEKNLTESLGHTFTEVVGGIILGTIIGLIF